jgi:hypothetical protein
MPSKFLAAMSATIFTLALSAPMAQAQNADASKKKIENITQYGVVRPSTGTPSGYTGTYNYPAKKPSIDHIYVPSPVVTKPTYVAPKSTATYTAPVVQRSTPTVTTTPAKKP